MSDQAAAVSAYDDDDNDVFDEVTSASRPWAVRARALIGLGALLAIGHRIYAAEQDMDLADEFDASAIQIVQLWTPHLFYLMAIIGTAISLYIITRAFSDA